MTLQDTQNRTLEDISEVATLYGLSEAYGHHHTLTEILQQPATWVATARHLTAELPELAKSVEGVSSIILTGSGSSEYAGDCCRPILQRRLGVTVQVVGAGTILTDGTDLFPASRPAVMISFARSGDSPESVAALQATEADAEIRQLVVTCNANGRLAQKAASDDRVKAVVLDEKTNDRSLVMTSSFTNMVLATMALAWRDTPSQLLPFAELLSSTGESLLRDCFELLPDVARLSFHRAFYLADATTFGAARESALKMTEMTAGRVMTAAETYLGLRHGPMSAVDANTLLVCYLSSDPVRRAYEVDLIEEINAKKLGLRKVLVGADIPPELLNPGDLALDHAGFAEVGDDGSSVLHVMVGQVLGFFRCMKEGLKPDAPSATGVINRVVQSFQLHGVPGAE